MDSELLSTVEQLQSAVILVLDPQTPSQLRREASDVSGPLSFSNVTGPFDYTKTAKVERKMAKSGRNGRKTAKVVVVYKNAHNALGSAHIAIGLHKTRGSAMAEGPRDALVSIETRVQGLSCGIICVILRLAVLIQYRSVTDRHTDT